MHAVLVLQIPKGIISPLCSHATPKGCYEEGFEIQKSLCKRNALSMEGLPFHCLLFNILRELSGATKGQYVATKCTR